MTYEEWLKSVPDEITGDSLWKMKAYRLGVFIADAGWHDVTKLMQDRRTLRAADQRYRSPGSISANLAEGYSRGRGKDRTHLYEYAPDRPERAATGTTKAGTSFPSRLSNIACACSPRLFVCC